MSEIELKPCPFCGGKAELKMNDQKVWAQCVECGARTQVVWIAAEYCANDKVAEAWNRRDDNG